MKSNKISPQTNVQLSKEGRPNVILNELRDKINSNENLKIDFDKCVKYIKKQNIRQINLKPVDVNIVFKNITKKVSPKLLIFDWLKTGTGFSQF